MKMSFWKKIYNWVQLLYFTKYYQRDFPLDSNLSFDDLSEKIELVFQGSYINPNYTLEISGSQIKIQHDSSDSSFSLPVLSFFNPSVSLKLIKEAKGDNLKVIVNEVDAGVSNSMHLFFKYVHFLVCALFIIGALLISFVQADYTFLGLLIFPSLMILMAYWIFSQRTAYMDFFSSKLLKTIKYIEENKALSLIRGIWS